MTEQDEGNVAQVVVLATAPLRSVSLATQAYDRLRRAISEGTLEEKTPLVISKLVHAFGISHTPLREALARLHSEGLVSFVDNVGYRVAELPSDSDRHHWMEARLALEVPCARLAAQRITAEELALLRSTNARIRTDALGNDFPGVRLFAELNAAFHRIVVAASRNPFLQRAHEQTWLGAHFSRVRYRRPSDHRHIIAEHRTLVTALARADGDAAATAMERHIVDSLERDRARPAADQATTVKAGRSRASRR